MRYSACVFDHIDSANLSDWQVVHEQVGDAHSAPWFLRIIHNSTGDLAPCRPVIFYDENEAPVGVTTISSCSLDVAQMAPKWARRFAGWVRRAWPGYLQFKTVMCGPAAAILHEKLYLLADVDRREILRLLDKLLCELAREKRAKVILMGDFDTADRPWLDALTESGYVAGDSHPAYRLDLPFRTFEEYLACMRSSPRCTLRRTRRPFARTDVTVDYHSGAGSAAAFTEQHYAFYLELLERVDLSMTTLPLRFFRDLLEHSSGVAELIDVRIAGQPAAFIISLHLQGRYEALFVGYDRNLNRDYLLYFNTHLQAVERALQKGCESLDVGATCDEFKASLGATARGRTIYVKALGLLRFPLRWFSSLLLPPHPPTKPRRIFIRDPKPSPAQVATPSRPF